MTSPTGPPQRPPHPSARRLIGGMLLVLAAGWFVGEAVTIAGWTGTTYDAHRMVISELGIPDCSDVEGSPCSRRSWVLNLTLLLTAARVGIAVVVLAPLLPKGAGRWLVVALGLLHAAGCALVGLYPTGAPDRDLGHGVGAVLAIVGGLLALWALAVVLRHDRAAVVWTLACAVVGSVGMLLFVLGAPAGTTERAAVYAPMVWQVGVGLALLRPRPREARPA